ncbi:MAG TPA: glycosyltransferase family 4 protein [Telluria sp.]|jgi:glycosyltransferase involved in cell wall biosynthesis
MSKLVVMIGPSPTARGGIASVIKTYYEHGYGTDGNSRFIASHVDGSMPRKALQAGIALAQFTSLLMRGKVALLHVHVASGVSFWRKAIFIRTARLFGCPVLFHLHGGAFCDFMDNGLSGWAQRFAVATVGKSTAAFALTDDSAAWLRERAGLAAVEVFPNPVAVPPFTPRKAGLRDVLFLGRIEDKKGVFDLIRAFGVVHAARPDVRLVLAGEGDIAQARALADELGLGASVVLPGWVDGAARAALMDEAAVFALPSHTEQMPMSILEAMACGIPVVATSIGAIPLMLSQGKCGILVQPRNILDLGASILRILEDNVLADTISASGLARVRSEYMVETVLERLARRYKELAA